MNEDTSTEGEKNKAMENFLRETPHGQFTELINELGRELAKPFEAMLLWLSSVFSRGKEPNGH